MVIFDVSALFSKIKFNEIKGNVIGCNFLKFKSAESFWRSLVLQVAIEMMLEQPHLYKPVISIRLVKRIFFKWWKKGTETLNSPLTCHSLFYYLKQVRKSYLVYVEVKSMLLVSEYCSTVLLFYVQFRQFSCPPQYTSHHIEKHHFSICFFLQKYFQPSLVKISALFSSVSHPLGLNHLLDIRKPLSISCPGRTCFKSHPSKHLEPIKRDVSARS